MMNAPVEAAPPLSAKEKRARLAERLRLASRRTARSPLSFAQQRLWFLDQLVPNSPLYNVPLAARLIGALNVPVLEKALQNIVARHEALRTHFECNGETPVQVVSSQVEFKLRVLEAANPLEAECWIREEVKRPFNLAGKEALLRAMLVRVAANEHLLALSLHHIVADEWSLKILFRELEEFYKSQVEGSGARLPELPLQYADYAAWQREWLNDQSLQQQPRFWKSQLDGKPQGCKPPLFLIHGAGGDVLWGYANLVAHMDHDQPIYALKSRGQAGLEEFERLEDMAACYVQAVRAQQPEGPYYVGGYCFGGNVAYEMARQIQAAGGRVALLALLDSAPANAGYEKVPWRRPEFIGLFARNLFYWLRDFRAVQPQDRRRFMARKLRAFGRKLARWARGARGGPAVDLEEIIDPAQFPEHELKLWEIHLRALALHVQRPYSGHVTLFRTLGHPLLSSFARDLRWGALALGGVTVNLIPGSHENIFMEPNVKSLALGLTTALSETQERAVSENSPALLPS